MSHHVCFEMGSPFGGVSALCASKRPLITVNSRVLNEGAVFIASVVTLIATVRLLCTIRSLIGMFCRRDWLYFHDFSAENPDMWLAVRLIGD